MLLAHAGELHEETAISQSDAATGQAAIKPNTTRTLNPATIAGSVIAVAIFVYVVYKLFRQKVS